MPPEPILDGETILATSVRNAVAARIVPAGFVWQDRPKIYWRANTDGAPLPYLVMRPATDFDGRSYLGATPLETELLLIAYSEIAGSAQDARDLLALAAPGLASLSHPGYVITARWRQSPNLPPTTHAWAAGHRFQVRIQRAS